MDSVPDHAPGEPAAPPCGRPTHLLFEQTGLLHLGVAQHPPHVFQLSLQLHTAILCSRQVGEQHCRDEGSNGRRDERRTPQPRPSGRGWAAVALSPWLQSGR